MSAAERRTQERPQDPQTATLELSGEGKVLAWNESAGRLLGSELVEGRLLAEIFPGAGAAIREALRGEAARPFCVAPLGARAGRALALACRSLPCGRWEAEVVTLAGGSGREAEILSALLHDLRTPLTTMLGAAELLETGRLGALSERATGILKALEGAGRQITEMLDKANARRDAPETGKER